jgi:class 3 adenylate cyclase
MGDMKKNGNRRDGGRSLRRFIVPMFKPGANAYEVVEVGKKKVRVLLKTEFEKFNPSLLGLGEIGKESTPRAVIAAIMDLQGFTNFCKQIDPQLSVPLYLNEFVTWLFASIRKEAVHKKHGRGVRLYHDLPFFAKFMGDGVMFLWDTADLGDVAQHNLVISMDWICKAYDAEFLGTMRRKVCEPPEGLRCGVAKGTVYPVGNGSDFVGPCVNLAARLQKLDGAMFAFSRRGLRPEELWTKNSMEAWALKKVNIRGMGAGELVYLRREEFETMSPEDKKKYQDP